MTAATLVLMATLQSFTDVTGKAGLSGNRSAAWGDVNEDGRPDLVSGSKLFLNGGDGSFADATAAAGLEGNPGHAALIADFDNDGHLDLFFLGGPDALYMGDGRGKFRKGQSDANPHARCEGAAAGDLDGDGWLDVYMANYETWDAKKGSGPFPDILLKNDKGRLKLAWTAPKEQILPGRGVTFCDFNEDDRIDLYVSNYRLAPNFLWVNAGGGKFADEADRRGCAGRVKPGVNLTNAHGLTYAVRGHTIGSLWADFDNDGLFDLFVGNFSHPAETQDRPQLLRNTGKAGEYRFVDRSADGAIPWQESYACPAAADFDNDGNVDLCFTTVYARDATRIFRNSGGWKFEDVTAASGVKSALTYQAAWCDFDGDGRVDLSTAGRLYRNETKAGSWLKVRLAGAHCNRSAVGARAFIRSGGRILARQVECGTGSGNQNDLTLHFGLGDLKGEVELEIRWPCGKAQRARVAAGTTVRVVETK